MFSLGAVSTADITSIPTSTTSKAVTSTTSRAKGNTIKAVTVATSRVGSTTTQQHGWSVARGSDCYLSTDDAAHIGECNWFHFMQRC